MVRGTEQHRLLLERDRSLAMLQDSFRHVARLLGLVTSIALALRGMVRARAALAMAGGTLCPGGIVALGFSTA